MLQCADVAPGRRHTPALLVLNSFGSPVTSGVVGSGSIYGPADPATSLAGPTALTHQGEGWWGLPYTTPQVEGLYRLVVPTLTFGGEVWTNQSVPFTVGPVPPECRRLRDILVAVCQQLGCGVASVVSGAVTDTPPTFIDARWQDAGLVANEFTGDEVLFLEPSAAGGTVNPARVTGLDPTAGKVTYTPTMAGQATGAPYLLIRAGRGGYRYARLREAIDAAIADVARRVAVTDTAALLTSMNQHHYTLPAGWLDVDRVQVRQPNQSTVEWWDVAATYWEYFADTRQLYLRPSPGQGYPLRITGTVAPQPARALSSLVRVPYVAVRDQAAGALALPAVQAAGMALQRGRAGRLRGEEG